MFAGLMIIKDKIHLLHIMSLNFIITLKYW